MEKGQCVAQHPTTKLEAAPAVALNENIFRFQITVNDVHFMYIHQRSEALLGNSLQASHSEVRIQTRLVQVPLELIKVVLEQLQGQGCT